MSQTDIHHTDTTSMSIPLESVPASTYHAKYFIIDTVTTAAKPSENLREFIEELTWNNVFNTSHVKRGLRRLAADGLQEFAAGETEEGGFAVE